MRMNLLGWLVAAVLVVSGRQIKAAEPAGIREPEKFIFEGVVQVAEKDVRAALSKDFDVILAGHPDGELAGYLRAIEASLQLGYQHSGFPQAKIEAEYDPPMEKIVVRVEEGPRFFCGDIVITGAKHVDTVLLAESLREPAKQEKTPWVTGRPVRLDATAMTGLINRIKEALTAQGFFLTKFDFRTSMEPGESAQKLEIIIKDEGPRAEIGKITIAGNERDSDAEILEYLKLQPGQRFDTGLVERLQKRLEESGRFVGSHITGTASQQDAEGLRIFDLNIDLRDYELATPLAGNFSAEEKALLQFRSWADGWSRGESDTDLVFDFSISAAELEQMCAEMELPVPPTLWAGIRRLEARMIQSAKQGQVVTLRFVGGEGRIVFEEVYAFSAGRLLIGSPQRNAKLDLVLNGARLKLNWQAAAKKLEDVDKYGKNFDIQFGITIDHIGKSEKNEPVPMTVTTSFKPAPLLSIFYEQASSSVLKDVVWHFEGDGLHFQLEADTGRLIAAQIETNDGGENEERRKAKIGKLTVRTEAGAYSAEWRKVEAQLAAAKEYDATTPLKSLFDFAFDECQYTLRQVDASADKLACCAALQKLVQRWSPPWPFPTDDDDKDKDGKLAFQLPPEKTTYQFNDLFSLDAESLRKCTPHFLAIYRELVPHDSWLWPVGRDLLLTRGSSSFVPVGSLLKTSHSSRLGPVGQFALASTRHPALQITAADAGMKLLSVEQFRKDYQPLLSGEGLLSKYLLTLADSIRSLDEEEVRSLTILVPENRLPRAMFGAALLSLKDEPDASAAESVARLFKLAWNARLRYWVGAGLQTLGPQKPRSNAGPWSTLSSKQAKENPNSASTKTTSGIQPVSTDKLDALEKLAEELQKSGGQKPEKAEEVEPASITERLDRLREKEKK